MESGYFAILLTLLFGVCLIGAMWALATYLGPRKVTAVKKTPFECGNPPTEPARKPVTIHFLVLAMLFLLFDIEVIFLYPWAIVFKSLGFFGIVEMFLFILLLVAGLIYCWRKGALEWV